MPTRTRCLSISSVLLACGCSSAPVPPLFFGDVATVGIDIGAGPGSTGVDFNLGFNQKSVAIVPVSAVNKGQAEEIYAWNQTDDGGWYDALSVFGQFKTQTGKSKEGETAKTARSITLGRFFATGLAATNLAEGYMKGWEDPPTNPVPPATARKAAKPKASGQADATSPDLKKNGQTDTTTSSSQMPQEGEGSNTEPYAPPLVFGQSHSLGIGIATSVADQGSHFTLGYAGRDIAIVPVIARSQGGGLTRLGGREVDSTHGSNFAVWPAADAYSVFGQFDNTTDTTSVRFGLNTFFTTGIAARNLTEGYKAAITRELKEQRQAKPTSVSATGQ